MKYIAKSIVAIFVGLVLMTGSVEARPKAMANPEPRPDMETMVPDMPDFCPHHAPQPVNMMACKMCYLPGKQAFVLVDSIDCAVDLLVREGNGLRRVGRFVTDVAKGRHDLKNVVRPVSVGVFGDKILVLASSVKDSSFLAVLNPEPVACVTEDGYDTLKAVNLVGFGSNARYFQVVAPDNEIIVVGTNPLGYDINVVDITEGLENMGVASSFHYHVPKQSERIQASDPHGWGLAIVAICVVFFALVCVCFIMKGYGAIIMKVQDRKSSKAVAKGEAVVPAKTKDVAGEVYAAIAAAIYAYEQDLHDEEDTVITIQKVERAWTPWNAKFYNMNQYFSTRK